MAHPYSNPVSPKRSTLSDLCHFGYLLLEKHEARLALEQFRAAIQLSPDYMPAYIAEGAALLKLERYGVALQSFRRAQELSPEPNADLLIYQAQALLKLRFPQRSLELCNEALAISPRHRGARWSQLWALWSLRRYAELFHTLTGNLFGKPPLQQKVQHLSPIGTLQKRPM